MINFIKETKMLEVSEKARQAAEEMRVVFFERCGHSRQKLP